jgi:hypothetical protein
MSDPEPTPDIEDKAGLPVAQPATVAFPQKPVAQPESSDEPNPDVIVKPGMNVRN